MSEETKERCGHDGICPNAEDACNNVKCWETKEQGFKCQHSYISTGYNGIPFRVCEKKNGTLCNCDGNTFEECNLRKNTPDKSVEVIGFDYIREALGICKGIDLEKISGTLYSSGVEAFLTGFIAILEEALAETEEN